MGKFLDAGIPLIIAVAIVAVFFVATAFGFSNIESKALALMAPVIIGVAMPILYGVTHGKAFDDESDQMLIATTTAIYTAMFCGLLIVITATSALVWFCFAVMLSAVGFFITIFIASEVGDGEWVAIKLWLPVGIFWGRHSSIMDTHG